MDYFHFITGGMVSLKMNEKLPLKDSLTKNKTSTNHLPPSYSLLLILHSLKLMFNLSVVDNHSPAISFKCLLLSPNRTTSQNQSVRSLTFTFLIIK